MDIMLARDPNDHAVWGIAYNGKARGERQRFTIAHELGHFILHRSQKQSFNCDSQSVHTGIDGLRQIEREADEFASNLLMPGDLLREWISNQRIDLHVLSAIAKRFQVSFEALCIRFIKHTSQRAILVCWDNGYLDYESRSRAAVMTRAKVRRTDDPQELHLRDEWQSACLFQSCRKPASDSSSRCPIQRCSLQSLA